MSPFQVKGKMIMNSLSLFAAISGMILLIMDIFNIAISHFFKMENLNLLKSPKPYIDIHTCQPESKPSEKNSLSIKYCDSIRSVFLVSVRLDFFSGKKSGIFITSANSGSRLATSATYCLSGFGARILTTFCLSFFNCKMGKVPVLTSQGCFEQ